MLSGGIARGSAFEPNFCAYRIAAEQRRTVRRIASGPDASRFSPRERQAIGRRVAAVRLLESETEKLSRESSFFDALRSWHQDLARSRGADVAQNALDSKLRDASAMVSTPTRYSPLKDYFEESGKVTPQRLEVLSRVLAIEEHIARYLLAFHDAYLDLATCEGCRPLPGRAQVVEAANRALVSAEVLDRGEASWDETPVPVAGLRLNLPLPGAGRDRYLGDSEAFEALREARRAIDERRAPPPVRDFLSYYLRFLDRYGIEPIHALRDLVYVMSDWPE